MVIINIITIIINRLSLELAPSPAKSVILIILSLSFLTSWLSHIRQKLLLGSQKYKELLGMHRKYLSLFTIDHIRFCFKHHCTGQGT